MLRREKWDVCGSNIKTYPVL